MATPPTKRRGISLDPRVDTAVSPDLLSGQPTPTTGAAAGEPAAIADQLEALHRTNADLQSRWQRQSEQLEQQLGLLEQQRDQIALQTRQLQALERQRRTRGRIAVLLTLLVLVAAGALGFHHWAEIEGLAEDWPRISIGSDRLAPEIQAMRTQLGSLTTDIGRMGSTIASLQQDVSVVRAELGALRQDVASASEARTSSPAAVPHSATSMSSSYRSVRPRMPW